MGLKTSIHTALRAIEISLLRSYRKIPIQLHDKILKLRRSDMSLIQKISTTKLRRSDISLIQKISTTKLRRSDISLTQKISTTKLRRSDISITPKVYNQPFTLKPHRGDTLNCLLLYIFLNLVVQ